jgi:hypothetical protein
MKKLEPKDFVFNGSGNFTPLWHAQKVANQQIEAGLKEIERLRGVLESIKNLTDLGKRPIESMNGIETEMANIHGWAIEALEKPE